MLFCIIFVLLLYTFQSLKGLNIQDRLLGFCVFPFLQKSKAKILVCILSMWYFLCPGGMRFHLIQDMNQLFWFLFNIRLCFNVVGYKVP